METIYLKDYQAPSHEIETCDLAVEVFEGHAIVDSKLKFKGTKKVDKIFLDGVDLEIIEIKIDGMKADESSYNVKDNGLEILKPKDDFVLETKVKINPFANTSGEGLYLSGDILCTQCEAEGFRKITYFLDRPDNLTKFTTKIISDKKYKNLLSNGNLIEAGDLSGNRHFATWEDPFFKPSYLFALVCGDLSVVQDSYTTKSGKDVLLEIYVDKGNEDKCQFAMESLKNSMKWDEDRFDLEYDLGRYMIVAVDSFNMGAMENKGLNIFNSAYVLAKQETATDSDFKGVEGVIGHEYFHNWTGNRVTCRDWFQLTLKEGLTVFRDQEFSSDLGSRAVKRIEDVKILKQFQMPEDAGALSHPIKPKQYSEINNFYTATVYDKGAEVIRMVHTLLGEENFQKGMKLYFERHDGQAVTTEDFIAAMSDASKIDLEQFKVWYDQHGTPEVTISETFNDGLYTVKFTQKAKLNNEKFSALHMPFYFNLYSKNKELLETVHLELKNKESTYSLTCTEKPIGSWNINYSAPVNVNYEYSVQDLATLASCDVDEFNRYNAFQLLLTKEIFRAESDWDNYDLAPELTSAITSLINDKNLDSHFLSYMLALPSEVELNNSLDKFRVETVQKSRNLVEQKIGSYFEKQFIEIIKNLDNELVDYEFNEKAIGDRALRLQLCSFLDLEKFAEFVYKKFESSHNMTDSFGFLKILVSSSNDFKNNALSSFYEKWNHEPLVIQKWFKVQAQSQDVTVESILNLKEKAPFDFKVPNYVRSLFGAFSGNITAFNKFDGSGYQLLSNTILELDKINPQIASRLAKAFTQAEKLDEHRKKLLYENLRNMEQESLSPDVSEIVSLALKS